MVTAIREGRKTQTRRVVKPQPASHITRAYALDNDDFSAPTDRWALEYLNGGRPWTDGHGITCPYGTVGDRLWGKETFFDVSEHAGEQQFAAVIGNYIYRADYMYRDKDRKIIGVHPWKPSIYMPFLASRIKQEITAVRVERVQDISEADASAEGLTYNSSRMGNWSFPGGNDWMTARDAYRSLWNSINLEPSPTYQRDPNTRKKHIVGYFSYPWSLADFHEVYGPDADTFRGQPLTIIANPWPIFSS